MIYSSFTEPQELKLSKALRPIHKLGCDYLYYLNYNPTSHNISYRFCTHEDWLDFYHEESLVTADPLKRVMINSKNAVLPWEQVNFQNKAEKQTMSARTSFGLNNGISIVCDYNNNKHILVLATENKEHDLARYLLQEQCHMLNTLMKNCIAILDEGTQKIAA